MTKNVSSGDLTLQIEEGVASICFSHPKGNSLPSTLLFTLAEKISACGKDPAVKAILLKSEGESVFCAGASFDELLNLKDKSQSEIFFSGFAKVIEAIIRAPKFVVAKVQGKAIGGGVGIIAACDYVLASKSATIRLSELSIGFGPFIIGPVVNRKIGSGHFQSLTIDTAWRDSEWCLNAGLFSTVREDLDSATTDLLRQLRSSNSEAMRLLKDLFWNNKDSVCRETFSRVTDTAALALTPFVREKVQALVRK